MVMCKLLPTAESASLIILKMLSYRVSKKKSTLLAGCGNASAWLIIKMKMLICQSRANADVTILFGKITHLSDPEIGKMLARGLFVLEPGFHVRFWSVIYLPSTFSFYPRYCQWYWVLNLNFNGK